MSRISTYLSSDGSPVPVRNLTSLMGRWSLSAPCARYAGAVDPDVAGLALSNISLSRGTVKATMTFDTDRIEYTSGGIVLGYGGANTRYLVVELAAYEAAYAIAESAAGDNKWHKLHASGCFRSIVPGRPYALEVVQLDTGITLVVDQVRVLEYSLPVPLEGQRVGLFGWGPREITFEEVSTQPAPLLFLAMPFSEPFDTLYDRLILPCAKRVGFDVIRMDEVAGPGRVVEEMEVQISQATVVLCEITSRNPNVMWESGYAQALKKPIIFLARRGRELPFDIRGYRVIFYDDTIAGKPALEEALERHLTTVFWSDVVGDLPVALAHGQRSSVAQH
jgi:hypothetical protein